MTRLAALLCTVTLACAAAAHSQTPSPEAHAPAAPRAARPAPTNLKVLPKTMTAEQVSALMHQYTGDLGVGCSFCHAAADPTTHHPNFAADTNPMKETARFMITMTAELNEKIDTMPGKMYGDPVTCGTCHRGEKHPSVFVPPPHPMTPPPPPTPPGR